MLDADLSGLRIRFAVCPEYLLVLNFGRIVPTPTPLSISNFAQFHLGAREKK